MGGTQSKTVAQAPAILSEKERVSVADLSGDISRYLTLDEVSSSSGSANPISAQTVRQWDDQVFSSSKNRLAQNAVCNTEIKTIVRQRTAVVDDSVHVFSDEVDFLHGGITNQESSGRCWIFASTNVFRTYVQRHFGVEHFQLSQSYLFFYDKLEKCNYFLTKAIEHSDLEDGDRLVDALFADPASDGGQWDMMVNLVEKYGLIPQTVMPDSYSATHSSSLNYVVVHKLREFGTVLRKVAKDKTVTTASLYTLKEKFVRELYAIIAIALGTPPKPDQDFVWEFYDKNGKFQRYTNTPKGFYSDIVKPHFDVSQYYSLVQDPRNPYESMLTVDSLGNVIEGKSIEYVNAPSSVLKQAAINAIKNNEPVFFGSDVGKFSDSPLGIMDTRFFDYELALGTKLGLTKADRLKTGDSAMTHAMVLMAVHLVDGKPTKWKVQNSWGRDSGDKGFFIMSDEWFDEYVLQVVTTNKYVDKKYRDVYATKKFTVLPRWDPMGALA